MGFGSGHIFENTVAAVLAGLDFNRLNAFMKLVDWKWGASVPSAPKIQQAARGLLEELMCDPDATSVEMGGLRAVREQHGDYCELRLAFEIDAAVAVCSRPTIDPRSPRAVSVSPPFPQDMPLGPQ